MSAAAKRADPKAVAELRAGARAAGQDPESFGSFLGIATWLMTMSAEHKGRPVSDIDRTILPAVMLRQFRLVKKDKLPVAFIAFAQVSDEVRARIEGGGAPIGPTEWRSGPNVIVVECISPFAPAAQVSAAFLKDMAGVRDPQTQGH